MNRIKKFIKQNYKIFIVYAIILIVMYIPLPYYIYAPGGIVNMNKRMNIENRYKAKGSFNLSYVSEYKGNLLTIIIGLIRKDWDIISNKDIVMDNETIKDYNNRDRLLLQESYSNATLVAYKKAHKNIKIINSKVYVQFIFEESKTNLNVGDQILSVNNIKIDNMNKLNKIIQNYKLGDKINIEVISGKQKKNKQAKLIKYNNKTIIGIGVAEINDYKTNPTIKYKYSKDEYGSSGGLMTALNIYNSITKKDITKGKTIVGTGTIDQKGNVGEIDGVKYKIKGASKKNIDLFIVPNANLKEALKVKKENKYKFDIIGVDTFDEAVKYLKKH